MSVRPRISPTSPVCPCAFSTAPRVFLICTCNVAVDLVLSSEVEEVPDPLVTSFLQTSLVGCVDANRCLWIADIISCQNVTLSHLEGSLFLHRHQLIAITTFAGCSEVEQQ